MIVDVVKVFAPATIAFLVGIALTPLVSHYLYKYQMWRKKAGRVTAIGGDASVYNTLEAREVEVGTPRMGGIIIWASAFLVIGFFALLAVVFPNPTTEKLDFLSRDQTWLPLFTLMMGALIGLVDDYFDVAGKIDSLAGGLSLKKRLGVVGIIGVVGAWWFFSKLGVSTVAIPLVGAVNIGFWFVPFFILVMITVYASGVIDGIDGLSGGAFAAVFAAFSGIAFFQDQINLAAFCAVVLGGILAFLWFNIPPARFFMSETGTMALTTTVAVVAFLTETVLLLPVIAFPLFVTVVTNVLQVISKKIRGKKIFLVAPIHHHFEAIGWPSYKVTMRYWIISIVAAIAGMILAAL